MRRAALLGGAAGLALAGCGGAKPAEPPQVSPRLLTRTPVADTDDGVEVVSGKGHIEPAAVEAGLAPHRDALSRCYTQRVGKRRWLGGRLSLRWEVAADGAIEHLVLADSDLGAWPIEKCVLEAAREASFGKPVGGPAEVSLPLEFSPTGRPASPVIWDDDQSLRAVGGQLVGLDACAEGKAGDQGEGKAGGKGDGKIGAKIEGKGGAKAGAKAGAKIEGKAGAKIEGKAGAKIEGKAGAKIEGKAGAKIELPDDVRITLYVGPRGRAESVGFASARAELDPEWADCAEKAALAWRLPDPRGQVAKLAVRYRPR
jgi:hypothetical protein